MNECVDVWACMHMRQTYSQAKVKKEEDVEGHVDL